MGDFHLLNPAVFAAKRLKKRGLRPQNPTDPAQP
jgi:hypothetical protein